jgi:hypothetical protein
MEAVADEVSNGFQAFQINLTFDLCSKVFANSLIRR